MKTRRLENIKIETDETDHFHFICPDCGTKMQPYEVYTQNETTYFLLRCNICKGSGIRKINHGSHHTKLE